MDSYIVDFAYFCHRCKHADKDVTETPCDECLDNPHSGCESGVAMVSRSF